MSILPGQNIALSPKCLLNRLPAPLTRAAPDARAAGRTGEKVPLRRTAAAAAALDEIRLLQKGTRRACRGVAPPAAGMGGALGAEPAATVAVQRAPSATYPSLGQTPTTRLKGRTAGGRDSSFIYDHFIRQTL